MRKASLFGELHRWRYAKKEVGEKRRSEKTERKGRREHGFAKGYVRRVRQVHLVLILVLAAPFLLLLDEGQQDAVLPYVYLAGLLNLLPVRLLYVAEEKAKHAGLYLPAAAVLVLGAGFAMRVLSAALFAGSAPLILTGESVVITVLYAVDAFRTRLNDNARAKAVRLNDPDWVEADLLPEPSLKFLAIFAVLYLAGLFAHSSGACTAVMIGAIAYFFPVLVYDYLSRRDAYLKGMKDVRNIPEKRIRRTGMLCLLIFLLPCAAAAILTAASAGNRTFLTMPEWQTEVTMEDLEEEPAPEMMSAEEFEKLMGGKPQEPPAWLTALLDITAFLVEIAAIAFTVWLILRGIFRIFREFGERTAENGDEIRKLEPEDEVQKVRKRGIFLSPLQDRTRRRYRRMILKYRKDRPGAAQTPSEIEAGTEVPDREELARLHDDYERVRYGKG